MLTKIDWISFSVLIDKGEYTDERAPAYAAARAIHDLHPNLSEWLALTETYEAGNGRAPYRTSWRHPLSGITFYTHPALPHALCEISGKGCDWLEANGTLYDVVRSVAGRLTRLDIASDIACGTRPTAFVAERREGRFKAHSEVVSESGETCYVGARTSNRFARVYRYNPPHERSHLLRVEVCVRAEDAKRTAAALLSDGLPAVAKALGEQFGWEHPQWTPDADSSLELPAWRPERRHGKTLYWLSETVAPLLARLHSEGVIDVEQWLTEQVRPRII